ncbi:MAG: hypothetical protein LBT95_07045 [Treponema sp.]|jgi:hypothetical protein|nr:hypothetical protein [Treponema sp.]
MAVDRHINFFELQKAAAKPGCPLCRIVADRAERYIDNMLFEHVSDRGFRAAHRAAGGFCPFHSRNLVSFRDGLAVAILGRDILEDRILSFKTRKFPKLRGRCPVCLEQDRIEEEYLSFLAQSGGDSKEEGELREIFTASEGLCAPHYEKLLLIGQGKLTGGQKRGLRLGQKPMRIPPWLVEFHEHKFAELYRRVGQFIELSAYGRQEEFAALPERDQLVWKELALILRGSAETGDA